jgi:AcrR family transcriptional regulator
MAGRTQHRSLQTFHKIVDSARALAEERGYGGVCTEDVARLAGVAKGTVFAHFGDKAGLLTALLVEELRRLTDRGDTLESSQVPTDPILALLDSVMPFLELLARERTIVDLYLRRTGITDSSCFPGLIRELERLQCGLLRQIEQRRERGQIRGDVECSILVEGIVAFVTQAALRRQCGEIPSAAAQRAVLEQQFSAWLLAPRRRESAC